MAKQLGGSCVALITPMKTDGAVDYDALAVLLEWHLEAGTNGFVPVGTTGEGSTLTRDEKLEIFRVVVKAANGKVPVIAGTGSNDTRATIELTKAATEVGVDAALVITPYYNKPVQDGLYAHFEAVHEATTIPMVLYNVPSRTGVNMTAATTIRCAELPRVAAVKEASGDLTQAAEILNGARGKIDVLSGEDSLTFPLICLGAAGVIGVTPNVVPAEFSQMVNAALEGNFTKAREIHYRLLPLMRALFLETNPIPVKSAVHWLRKTPNGRRLPLTELTSPNAETLRQVMQDLELM